MKVSESESIFTKENNEARWKSHSSEPGIFVVHIYEENKIVNAIRTTVEPSQKSSEIFFNLLKANKYNCTN
jgi:hypothetical protein